ncbi:MAG: hypothetical protein KAR25_06035 [Methanosarcinales archaeon]|nr:hypothetical protein [Methanosarcinales archaeon]
MPELSVSPLAGVAGAIGFSDRMSCMLPKRWVEDGCGKNGVNGHRGALPEASE